jgi:hypothetical protein
MSPSSGQTPPPTRHAARHLTTPLPSPSLPLPHATPHVASSAAALPVPRHRWLRTQPPTLLLCLRVPPPPHCYSDTSCCPLPHMLSPLLHVVLITASSSALQRAATPAHRATRHLLYHRHSDASRHRSPPCARPPALLHRL